MAGECGSCHLVFHLSLFALFVYTVYQDIIFVPPEILLLPHNQYSKSAWLTMVDLALQTLYHFFGVVFCLVGWQPRAFHFLGKTLIAPLGVAVAVLFWGLWVIDPKALASDENAAKIMAHWSWNNGLHTLPAISAFLDVIVWKRPVYSFPSVVKTHAVFSTFYIGNVNLINVLSGGRWPYPMLQQLGPVGRSVVYALSIAIVIGCYGVLNVVDRLVHGSAEEKPRPAEGKRKAN